MTVDSTSGGMKQDPVTKNCEIIIMLVQQFFLLRLSKRDKRGLQLHDKQSCGLMDFRNLLVVVGHKCGKVFPAWCRAGLTLKRCEQVDVYAIQPDG